MQKEDIVFRDGFENALYKNNDEIIISKSPYSAYDEDEEYELVFNGKKDYVNTAEILLQFQDKNLKIMEDDSLDLDIIKSLLELEFAQSRMITTYLNITGIKVSQNQVNNRLKYLSKFKITSSYKLRSKSKDGKVVYVAAPIYFLDLGAKLILESQKIPGYTMINTILSTKKGIKEALSRNHLMLTYIMNIKNIEYTKNSPTYKLSEGNIFNPNLLIVFDYEGKKNHMLFEFIRSYKGWKKKTIEKLKQYKEFIENFVPSKTIPSTPGVVLVAEDDTHALEILKLIRKYHLNPENRPYIFTTDIRVLSTSIKENSMFVFDVKNNKAKIELMSPKIFEI